MHKLGQTFILLTTKSKTMKSKLLVLGGLFLFLTAFTVKPNFKRKANKPVDLFQIGYFTVNGQEYDAYGSSPSGGSVYKLYITDNNGNDVSLANSWTGTYTSAHYINISFKPVSTSSSLTFSGYCSY
jgi:hypothetical protein